jgi:hypothetical protein
VMEMSQWNSLFDSVARAYNTANRIPPDEFEFLKNAKFHLSNPCITEGTYINSTEDA